MNAAETIQAAIVKLTEFNDRYAIAGDWLIEYDKTVPNGEDPRIPLTRDDYALTLHRTIDAQLAILQSAYVIVSTPFAGMWLDVAGVANEYALAKAILGVDS